MVFNRSFYCIELFFYTDGIYNECLKMQYLYYGRSLRAGLLIRRKALGSRRVSTSIANAATDMRTLQILSAVFKKGCVNDKK